jgi:hypothetical protein
MLGGFLVTTAWGFFGLWMEEQSRAMEGSCECIEYAADKRQGVVLQLGVELTTLRRKKIKSVTKVMKEPRTSRDSLGKRPKRWNKDMRFGLWNARILYRVGTQMALSRELSRNKLDLVGLQEVRWESSGTELAGEYTFF